MRTRLTALAMLLIPTAVLAQDPGQIQRLFESGKYQQVVDSTTPDSPPDVLYTTAQSQQKLGANDQAAQTFSRLAERPEADPWHFIGLSGRQLVEGNPDAAIASARQAATMAPELPYAHFQLGLVLARQQQWAEAAAAFDEVSASAADQRLRVLLRRHDALPRQSSRSDGGALRAVPQARARGARAAGGALDHANASKAIRTPSWELEFLERFPIPKTHRPVSATGRFQMVFP